MKHYTAGFFPGFVIGVLTAFGCASTWVFPYRNYALDQPTDCFDQAKLLGKLGTGGWPDLPGDTCKPAPSPSPGQPEGNEMPCSIVMTSDWYILKADSEKCHNDLQNCQKGSVPSP
jgi:hypothetical protein